MLGLFLTFILIFCLFSSCHFPPNPSKVRFRRQLLSILEGILGFDQFFIKGDYLYHQIRWISILCFLLPLFLSSGLGASALSFVCQSVCLFVRRSVTTFYIECRTSKRWPKLRIPWAPYCPCLSFLHIYSMLWIRVFGFNCIQQFSRHTDVYVEFIYYDMYTTHRGWKHIIITFMAKYQGYWYSPITLFQMVHHIISY